MSKFTIEQRNKIYKEALNMFEAGNFHFLCPAIDYAAYRSGFNKPFQDVKTLIDFPEFESFEPEDKYIWWEAYDRTSRIACLKKCIEITNK